MPPIDDDDDDRPRKKKSGGGTALITIIVVVVVILGCGGLLLTGGSKVRGAAARTIESNNMKQVILGAHNHASVNAELPPAEGRVSWRVHILPYVEQEGVYRQFNLNQDWNEGQNQQTASILIKTYVSPLDEPGTTQTHYRTFTGPGTIYDPKLMKGAVFPNYIADGVTNTIFAVDTAEMVPWPQPKEIAFEPNGSLPELGNSKRVWGVLIAMCDGSVKLFGKKTMDPNIIRRMVTAAGGEDVPAW